MLKRCFLLGTLFLFAVSCQKKETSFDFEKMMGKGLPAWEHLQTQEDFENLQFFKSIFEKNSPLLAVSPTSQRIPQVIHFIWIGPKPFPRESVDNVRSWMVRHPGWKVKFWTDRDRPLPYPGMELTRIQDFSFYKVGACYQKSDNYGEMSDLLRYEILYQEGGIYVDHDVKCLKSFDVLNGSYDFYCGLEMPYKTCLSSSILPTNNIVASIPHHPILQYSLNWLCERWDQIEQDYPGKDRDSVISRVSHRTFFVLGEAIKKHGNQDFRKDMVFPAFYFNAPSDELALFSRHQYAGSWFEGEPAFEKMVRERLMMLSKKTNRILLYFTLISLLNFIGISLLLFFTYRKRAIRR